MVTLPRYLFISAIKIEKNSGKYLGSLIIISSRSAFNYYCEICFLVPCLVFLWIIVLFTFCNQRWLSCTFLWIAFFCFFFCFLAWVCFCLGKLECINFQKYSTKLDIFFETYVQYYQLMCICCFYLVTWVKGNNIQILSRD